MPSPLIRRGIWAIAGLVLATALIISALPLLASTRIVHNRIAYELSSLSGYQVIIEAPPEIEVWPNFRAILTNVRLLPWGQSDHPPVIEAERVEIGLSPFAALAGRVEFSNARLVRPTLRLERTEDGSLLMAQSGSGRISLAVQAMRETMADNTEAPDPDRMSGNLGNVEVADGRVTVFADTGDSEIVTGVSGKLAWPALNKAATVKAAGIWRGEAVSLEISSPNPLMLLAGGEAPLVASMNSAPATASFDGVARSGDRPYFKGKSKFATPSLRRILEWSGADAAASNTIGAVSVAGQMSGDAGRVKFEEAAIVFDDNPGMGSLDLALGEGIPLLSGSLAFETLDLKMFLSAFTPLTPAGAAAPASIDPAFSDRLNLDLRLSAAKATAGSVTLANVAATVQVKSGMSAFDISDASAFGGNIQAGVRFDRKPDGTQVEMRLLASEVDGGAFATAAGMTRLVPISRGNVSVILKGGGRAWDSILENSDGSISANFGEGALSDFDLASFLKLSSEGRFFALEEVAKGPLPMEGVEVKANVSRGVIRIEKAEARTAQGKLWLNGIIPYAGGGLALSGGLLPLEEAAEPAENNAQPPVRFFVGGTWNAPFISPIKAPLTAPAQ